MTSPEMAREIQELRSDCAAYAEKLERMKSAANCVTPEEKEKVRSCLGRAEPWSPGHPLWTLRQVAQAWCDRRGLCGPGLHREAPARASAVPATVPTPGASSGIGPSCLLPAELCFGQPPPLGRFACPCLGRAVSPSGSAPRGLREPWCCRVGSGCCQGTWRVPGSGRSPRRLLRWLSLCRPQVCREQQLYRREWRRRKRMVTAVPPGGGVTRGDAAALPWGLRGCPTPQPPPCHLARRASCWRPSWRGTPKARSNSS